MWELVHSLVALRDPSHAALHVPWLRSLSGRLDGLALEQAVALTPPRGFAPDFLTPPPAGPLGQHRGRPRRAAQHPHRADPRGHGPVRLPARAGRRDRRAWLAHPRREVRRLADLLEAYWARAVEPVWPRVLAFLDADIAYRSRRLAASGPAALFGDLCDGVAWTQQHLDVQVPAHEATIELGGRGLLLMPSAFSATRPVVIDRAPWQPTVIYPARGIATLWEDAAPAPDGLARLLGATRAAVLTDLAAPRSTTEVAERLSLSPAADVAPPHRPARCRARHRASRGARRALRAYATGRRLLSRPLTVSAARRARAAARRHRRAGTRAPRPGA